MLNVPDRSPQLNRIRSHGPGEANDFFRPLAFHRQAHQQGAHLSGRGFTAHDDRHRVGRLVDRQVLAPHQFFQ
jgi:hypothetical protein